MATHYSTSVFQFDNIFYAISGGRTLNSITELIMFIDRNLHYEIILIEQSSMD